jgi:predicted site-specific integrase-resolvase
MPVRIDGETYYRTLEVLKQANISRSTLLRWIDRGIIADTSYHDRRGWRLFKKEDVARLVGEARKIQ